MDTLLVHCIDLGTDGNACILEESEVPMGTSFQLEPDDRTLHGYFSG